VPASPSSIEMYVRQWLKTASPWLQVEFTYGTAVDPFGRCRIYCAKCDHALTCHIPESAEKLDWSMQRFVELHSHPNTDLYRSLTFDPAKSVPAHKIFKETFKNAHETYYKTPEGAIPKTKWIEVPLVQETPKMKPWRPKDGRRFRETN
jgi:hypothetical protein